MFKKDANILNFKMLVIRALLFYVERNPAFARAVVGVCNAAHSRIKFFILIDYRNHTTVGLDGFIRFIEKFIVTHPQWKRFAGTFTTRLMPLHSGLYHPIDMIQEMVDPVKLVEAILEGNDEKGIEV